MSEFQADIWFSTPYPFVRDTYDDAGDPIPTWRPGVRYELLPPDGGEEAVADGVGEMHLRVISTHKPGRYPERVFYLRQWRDPDGRVFGSPSLKIASIHKFRRLTAGYAFPYRLQEAQGEGVRA